MGRKLGRRIGKKRFVMRIKEENGYLLLSTLFFLILSGLFSHSMIKITSYQIIQLRQYSTAYKAKGALNMGEELFKEYIQDNNDIPNSGWITTSVGDIEMIKESENNFIFKLTLKNGLIFSKKLNINQDIQEINQEKKNEEIPKVEKTEP